LRRRIGEAEVLATNLKGAGGAKALALLELLDQIEADRAALKPTGIDLRAEEGRIAALQSAVKQKKGILLKELRPLGGLAPARAGRQPPSEYWWWFLDQAQQAERRRAARRALIIAGVVLLVGIAAILVYEHYFRPNPLTTTVYTNQIKAQNYMIAGQFQEAIPLLEQNMQLAPTEAEWPIRLGVVKAALGDVDAGESLFQQGRRLAPDELTFLLQRGQVYIEVGQFERARDDMLRATQLNPQSAVAHYYLGRAYAGLNDRPAAMVAYARAAELAQNEEGSETIYVLARVEMMSLLQAPGAGDLPAQTPAPSETPAP